MSTDAPQNADQSPARERPGIEIQQPTPSWNTWLSKFFWGRSGSQPQYPVSGSQDMIERSVSSCEPSCICEASKVACTLTFFLAQLCIPPDPRRPSSAPALGNRSRTHSRSKSSMHRVEQDPQATGQVIASTFQGAHNFSINGSPQFCTVGTQNNVTNFGPYGTISLLCATGECDL
jgi:hypothetical protein